MYPRDEYLCIKQAGDASASVCKAVYLTSSKHKTTKQKVF